MAEWLDIAVIRMHRAHITQRKLAAQMGLTEEYISEIFCGKREPAGIAERVFEALDALIGPEV